MVSAIKKTKLDSETRNFNDDCTLPTLHNSKPTCRLCNECVLAVKEYNLKRHFTTKHEDFGISYGKGLVARKSNVESCYIN